ncbi:hypothetical protein [Deinococcus kurensis]|uniref:hypothetical protein n=1 Tax=Deinococcus kurensis TaxID=2662757 RepID=UPI0012D2E04D|nr:hypothetical protein [Deinococcus kurensis]
MSREQPVFTVDADAAVKAFTHIAGQLKDLRPVFRKFHAYHSREVDGVFKALGRGGTHRGITWRDWAPSSMPHARKRKGLRHYSVSGRKKLPHAVASGGGMTLGARRPSGRRVGPGSKLLQDTGTLRRSASTGVLVLNNFMLVYGSNMAYAEAQAAHRPWYSFTKGDGEKLVELARAQLAVDRLNGGRS